MPSSTQPLFFECRSTTRRARAVRATCHSHAAIAGLPRSRRSSSLSGHVSARALAAPPSRIVSATLLTVRNTHLRDARTRRHRLPRKRSASCTSHVLYSTVNRRRPDRAVTLVSTTGRPDELDIGVTCWAPRICSLIRRWKSSHIILAEGAAPRPNHHAMLRFRGS